MPLSKFFSNHDVRSLVAFAYTIIFQTFNIVGDNLTFMVAKVKPNAKADARDADHNPVDPWEDVDMDDDDSDDDMDDDMDESEEEDVDFVYFSPILYVVQIPIRYLDAILDQMLGMLIGNKSLRYYTPDKYHDYHSPCPLTALWLTPFEFKRTPNGDITVETVGNYSLYHTDVTRGNIRMYAYTIIQGYLSQISSLLELKRFVPDHSLITIFKYWGQEPVREMNEEEFWATFDEYVGQALGKLASFNNIVELSNTNEHSCIKRVF